MLPCLDATVVNGTSADKRVFRVNIAQILSVKLQRKISAIQQHRDRGSLEIRRNQPTY